MLAVCAACGFKHGASAVDGNTSDVPPAFDDAGHEIDTWIIDTAADFMKGTRVDVGIDPWGSLTPAGYFYDSLYAVGAAGAIVWQPTDATFSVDAAATATPTGAQLYFISAIGATTNLSSLGIAGPPFSAWSIGEVHLTAGTTQFQLQANDVGFVEIAPPHSTAFSTLVVSTGSTLVTQPFVATDDGWYPIRLGMTTTTTSLFDLQITPSTEAVPRRFARNEMRARIEEGRGLMQMVHNHELLAGIRSSHQAATDALAGLTLPLYGQPGNAGAFSARWAGQFYAKDAGAYVLQVTSLAGNRIAAAGQSSGSNYATDVASASSSMVTLNSTGPGWYDLVIDLNEPASTAPALAVTVASGPELVGMPLPLDRLRAVEPPGDRIPTERAQPMNLLIPDHASATVTLPVIAALPGETVTSLVARLSVDNPEYGSGRLKLELQSPHGDKVTLDGTAYSVNASGTATYYWPLDPTTTGAATLFANATVDGGAWSIIATDQMTTSGGGGGQIHEMNLVLHTSGGPNPIAPDAQWTSEVVDTMTALFDVDSVTWVERATTQPAKVQLRACDAPCVAEPWVDAVNGAAIDLGTGHRYLQARAEMFSDGIVAPEFEKLTIVYKRNAP